MKRDNWTNEEVIAILQGMKLVPRSSDDMRAKLHNDGLDDAIDEFHAFSLPDTESGAMAMEDDGMIVHIGPALPKIKVERRRKKDDEP